MGMVLGVAFVVLLMWTVGDVVRRRRRGRGSGSSTGAKGTARTRLREAPWSVRVAVLLVAAWAVWLLAFVAWAWSTSEWHKPAANDELYFGYTVICVLMIAVAAIGVVAAIRRPGRGEIGGGLLVTLLAQWGSREAVTDLKRWGELDDPGRGTPWVPLDSLGFVPSWVLLVAGILLLVGGIVRVRRPTHGSTPHAGAPA